MKGGGDEERGRGEGAVGDVDISENGFLGSKKVDCGRTWLEGYVEYKIQRNIQNRWNSKWL